MTREIIAQFKQVSKSFSRTPQAASRPGAKTLLRAMIGLSANSSKSPLRADEFWAVRNVNFAIHRGEALGIVGLNGAGKSTLLKILLGRIQANEGEVTLKGRAGGLVELGAGFHPELTGRRNIYASATLQGIDHSTVEQHLDEIIEFADIGSFIDSPVKTYSSGMKIRLGFSIAVHFVPDVMVCDEVLAVGDFEFRQKCLQKIKEVRKTRSVILVSHSTQDIALFCNKALLLHRGESILLDTPKNVLKAYSLCTNHISANELRRRIKSAGFLDHESALSEKKASPSPTPKAKKAPSPAPPIPPPAPDLEQTKAIKPKTAQTDEPSDETKEELFGKSFWKKEAIKNISIEWNLPKNENGYYLFSGEELIIYFKFTILQELETMRVGLPVFDASGTMLLGPDSRAESTIRKMTKPGSYEVTIRLDPFPLNSGRYWAALAICDDPAHVFRTHLPGINVLNPTHEFGIFRTHSQWLDERDNEQGLNTIYKR